MSTDKADPTQHLHYFLGEHHARNERRVWWVIALTASMMVGEIAAGLAFGSMALVADGWHMFTHAGALTIAALAYGYARRHAGDARFSFGTGKIGELAGYTSAVVLALVAAAIGWESAVRLVAPVPIAFDQAIAVAALGLVVNLLSMWLLHAGSGQGHRTGHGHHGTDGVHPDDQHDDEHSLAAPLHARDTNFRAAYVHVVADAATSILAIVGLLAGRLYGWVWMDALMGMVGGAVIARWSYGLLRSAGAVLVDMVPDAELAGRIRQVIENQGARVSDLHLWQIGPGHHAVIVAVIDKASRPPSFYRSLLADIAGVSHVTVEIDPA